MSDIVERLRTPRLDAMNVERHEAADEIVRLREALAAIADIAEGSTTANSLPNIARIARAKLESPK